MPERTLEHTDTLFRHTTIELFKRARDAVSTGAWHDTSDQLFAAVTTDCAEAIAIEIAASRQANVVDDGGVAAAMSEGLAADRAADNLPSGG